MGVETDQVDLVVQVHSAGLEDALQDLGIEKEGGAEVEMEPVRGERRGPASHASLLLENLDVETGLGEQHRIGETSWPCSDDDDFLGSATSSLSAPTPHDVHLR